MNVISTSMLEIPKHIIREKEGLKSDLVIHNPQWHTLSEMGIKNIQVPKFYEEYQETEDHIYVPRFFDPTEYLYGSHTLKIVKEYIDFPRFAFKHTIKLRPDQNDPYHCMWDSDGQILQLGCGRGKTVLGIKFICERQMPALVVVPTREILRQWKESFLKFTNVSETMIGTVRGKTVFNWKHPIVLTTIQSLSLTNFEKFYPYEFYEFREHFGVIVFDEVHRLAAEQFRVAASMFPGIRVGLSASARMKGGMDRLYRLHLGKIIHTDISQPLTPNIVFLQTPLDFEVNQPPFKKHWEKYVNRSRVDTFVSRNNERTQCVFDFVNKLYKQTDRRLLVVGTRKEFLEYLHKEFVKMFPSDADSFGLVIGSATSKKKMLHRENELRKRIVFGIEKIMKEGLDIEMMDTLIVINATSDKTFFQQVTGRICREYPGKNPPFAYFFVDSKIPMYRKAFDKLRGYARVFKYPVSVREVETWG